MMTGRTATRFEACHPRTLHEKRRRSTSYHRIHSPFYGGNFPIDRLTKVPNEAQPVRGQMVRSYRLSLLYRQPVSVVYHICDINLPEPSNQSLVSTTPSRSIVIAATTATLAIPP